MNPASGPPPSVPSLYGSHKFVQLGKPKDLSQQPYDLFLTADEMSDLWTSSRTGGQQWLHWRRIEHLRTAESRAQVHPWSPDPLDLCAFLLQFFEGGPAVSNDASSGAWASFAWRRPDFRFPSEAILIFVNPDLRGSGSIRCARPSSTAS